MHEQHGARPVVTRLAIVCLAAALAFAFDAQADCAAWLNAAEVESALGIKLETQDPVEYSPGFTVCSWTKDRPEGQLGVSLSFFELEAMREPGPMSAESIPEYFDLQVASKKEQDGKDAVELERIGKRAAMFSEDVLTIVMIELEEGFVHLAITPSEFKREQVEALAKAAASRGSK